jgi:hypothetical protein
MKSFFQFLCLALALPGALTPALAQTAISPAASTTPDVNSAAPDGFVMINGKVHVVHQGQAVPLDREMTLRVTPTGITGFDQRPRNLTGENMLTMDGRVVPAPQGLVIAPPLPKINAEDARHLDSGVAGENVSGLAPAQPIRRSAAVSPAPPARISGVPATNPVTQPALVPVTPPVESTVTTTTTAVRPTAPARAATVFDPTVTNDGSIEAAGTGTRRPPAP